MKKKRLLFVSLSGVEPPEYMDLSFTYREYPPPESLRQYVKSFWVFEPTTSAPAELRFSPIPDGFPGMIFQLGEQPAFHDTGKNPMPPVFVFRSA